MLPPPIDDTNLPPASTSSSIQNDVFAMSSQSPFTDLSSDTNELHSDELPSLTIEAEECASTSSTKKQPVTRCITDMDYILEQIYTLAAHNKSFGCHFGNLKLIRRRLWALACQWVFQFKMYSDRSIDPRQSTEDMNLMPILSAAVGAVVTSGNGPAVLDCILSTLEIPGISPTTYSQTSDTINKIYIEAAAEEMISAGKEEADLAIRAGDVGEDGIPNIKVTADGCWARRSFGRNYNSLGGIGIIIGLRTKKVVFMGILNKYCYRCSVKEGKMRDSSIPQTAAPDHTCFRNYKGKLVQDFRRIFHTTLFTFVKPTDFSTLRFMWGNVRNRPTRGGLSEKLFDAI